ncbi:MAG: AMP-dependent synthetase/ligase [Acidobacteriota bacterium]
MKRPPLYPVYPIETLRDLVRKSVDRYQDRMALQSKKEGKYQPTTFRQLGERVEALATTFFRLDLQKGDRLAILSRNRTEWAITYLAAVSVGLVVVPIDKDLKPREIRHILGYSGASLLVSGSDYLDALNDSGERIGTLKRIVSMDEERDKADLTFSQALEQGYRALGKGATTYRDASVGGEDLAAIIFTSGTMGSSKAVMLSHGNLAANIMATSEHVSISNDDRLLSVLPLHHTYECTCGFLTALYQGATIYHAENLRRIPENLRESRATVMLGVPLLFESMYRRIEKGILEKGKRKFRMAQTVAAICEKLLRVDVRRRLFKPLHETLGGRLRLLISGGAAIDPEVSKGFRKLGINFIQGYGMTEASPLIAVNREDYLKDGSVGLPLNGIELRFVEGEILVHGRNVMQGYYLNDDATRASLQDGWLYTGDLGYLTEEGFLYISGRKKSVIVTPNGKNVYPEEIESVLNQNPYVLESLVWGGPSTDPSKVEVQAIIVPDTDQFDHEFGAACWDEAKLREVIGGEVKKSNRQLANYKRIKKFRLRQAEFEKTTTRKIKRYLYTGQQQTFAARG